MANDLLKVHSNERVDLNDMQYLSDGAWQAAHRQLAENFLVDPGKQKTFIIDGFETTNPAAQQVQVTRGRAFLAQREGGVVVYSVLSAEGDADKVIDASTLANGTYGVYIRFEYVDGASESRIFWNAAGTGSEFAQTVATQRQANWSMRAELASPGAEWTKVAQFDVAGGVITLGPDDHRPFYFEGSPNGVAWESGWSSEGGGVANDRNSDRANYGCFDLQTFNSAVRQCIEDVKGRGLRKWWDKGIGGMNVGFDDDPVEDRVAVGDADFSLELVSPYAYLHFDDADGDYLRYDRTSERFDFAIGGSYKAQLDTNGMVIPNGLVVGFSGTPSNDRISIGDADFYLERTAFYSYLMMDDGTDDMMVYDRSADEFLWYIGGSGVLDLLSTGLYAHGDVWVGGFDLWFGNTSSNDRIHFDETNDRFQFYSDAIEIARFDEQSGAGASFAYGVRVGDLGDAWDNDLRVAGGINCGGSTDPAVGEGIFTDGIVVGYDGSAGADEVRVGDTAFKLDYVDANHVRLQGDSNDYIEYDRADNVWRIRPGNTNAMEVRTDGMYANRHKYLNNQTVFIRTMGSMAHFGGGAPRANGIFKDDLDSYIAIVSPHQALWPCPHQENWILNRMAWYASSLATGSTQVFALRTYNIDRSVPFTSVDSANSPRAGSITNVALPVYETYNPPSSAGGWFIIDNGPSGATLLPYTFSYQEHTSLYTYNLDASNSTLFWCCVLEMEIPRPLTSGDDSVWM